MRARSAICSLALLAFVPGASSGALFFSSPIVLQTRAASAIVAGDLDGDGVLDLVTALRIDGEVSVRLGRGDGSFGPGSVFPVGSEPSSVVIAQLDGQPGLDLAVGNAGSGSVSVLLGTGDGSFAPAVELSAALRSATDVVAADIDGDGRIDLAVCDRVTDEVTVLLGGGDGTFGAGASFPAETPLRIEAADLDGDGWVDLVTANGDQNTVDVFLGQGDGNFDTPVSSSLGATPTALTLADVDHDGTLDAIATSYVDGESVRVLLGLGGGRFAPALTQAVPWSLDVRAADFDRDGAIDLLVTSRVEPDGPTPFWRLSVLPGNGDGSFRHASSTLDRTQTLIAAGDFDSNSRVDVALAGGVIHVVLTDERGRLPTGAVRLGSEYPSSVASADFDGDEVADLVVDPTGTAEPEIYLGLGDGTFAPPYIIENAGLYSSYANVVELDDDGVADIVTANLIESNISVFHGRGDGSFQRSGPFPSGIRPFGGSVVAEDLDGDGLRELIVLHTGAAVLPALPGGGYGAPVIYRPNFGASGAILADLTSDGILDLVAVKAEVSAVRVLPGTGAGGFEGEIVSAGGRDMLDIAAGDLNGDALPDLVTASLRDNVIEVLLGNGDGTVSQLARYASGINPVHLAIEDLDCDGIPDVLVGQIVGNGLTLFRGNGDGSLREAVALSAPTNRALALSDFDGNGTPDIALTDIHGGAVEVLLNRCSSTISVRVDIVPGSASNRVVPGSHRRLRIALLGGPGFDVGDVDPASLAFGPGGASVEAFRVRDLDRDGFLDGIAWFRVRTTAIALGDDAACLSGTTRDGVPFAGCDAVTTTPRRGRPIWGKHGRRWRLRHASFR